LVVGLRNLQKSLEGEIMMKILVLAMVLGVKLSANIADVQKIEEGEIMICAGDVVTLATEVTARLAKHWVLGRTKVSIQYEAGKYYTIYCQQMSYDFDHH
jgi:hypothetical protein